jgi:AAA-like domain
MGDTAQLFTGVHDTPVYTNVLFDKPLRVWVAVPAVVGTVVTVLLTVLNLSSGHALGILIVGAALTAALTGCGAMVPRTRPSMAFRLRALRAAARPAVCTSTDTAILARPELVDNLWFGVGGSVYAGFLLAGLPYHLKSTRGKTAVADLHMLLGRELPADSWLFGLGVTQDHRQLLRAMVHGYRDRTDWVASCAQVADQLAAGDPKTRLFWLMVPVDAGRAGHNVVGQATKLKDWIAGRDKDSDSSLRAYTELAYDIANSLPPEFSPVPVTPTMSAWFWRHNAWLGTYTDPLPRRSPVGTASIRADQLPIAAFDEGDQQHRPQRPGIFNALPSWKKYVRVSSAGDGPVSPDSYQAILPVVDAPEGGIVFPGSEFLSALDDLDTGAVFDFAINLTARPREMEFRRNDRARGNIDDQYDHRGDVRNGYTELQSTERKIAEYNRLLSANIDEQPMTASFFVHVGAADAPTLDHSIKRLREEMTQSGQIVVRHYRGAHTRLWSVFNPGVPQHKSGADQFDHATTATKWSRFVPLISAQLGNATGMLLGFNKSNANNSAVLLDLPAAARRNHNPCLVCAGAPGYGKSYTAKRVVKAELQRGAQAFIVEPDEYGEWATALADVPNKAVIDMAGGDFGCDALRIFPDRVAGSYWLDYMIPMLGLDVRSVAVGRLRTLLTPPARRTLKITSTAALMSYIRGIQAPVGEADTRPAPVAQLAEDLRPVLLALESWATYEFTKAIFDDSLPVPDLTALDVTIWQTGSLDLPDAEEMSSPHLYAALSDRQRASIAIYGMLVRLARVSFFNNTDRFGLLVLEEAGPLLNSRTGARDAHLISRRARKHYTGMIIITQNPVKDLALMGDEFVTQQVILPFEKEGIARAVAASVGLPLQEYPEFQDFFLAKAAPSQMRDPTAFDEDLTEEGTLSQGRGDLEGRAFFVDEFGRLGSIRVAREPDEALHRAYDTTPGQGAA